MESLFIQGVEHTKSKHYPLALQCFSLGIQHQPSQQHLYLNRGCVYLCMHMEQSAINDFKEAICLDPYVHEAHFNRFIGEHRLGRLEQSQQAIIMCLFACLLEVGQRTSSQEIIKQSLQLIPGSRKARMILGDLYKRMGRLQESMEAYDTVLRSGLEFEAVLGKKAEVLKALNRNDQYEETIQRICSAGGNLLDYRSELYVKIQSMNHSQRRRDIQLKLARYYSLKMPKTDNKQTPAQISAVDPSVQQDNLQLNKPTDNLLVQIEEQDCKEENTVVDKQVCEPMETGQFNQEQKTKQYIAQGLPQVQLGQVLQDQASLQVNTESHSVQYQDKKTSNNTLEGLEKQLGLSDDIGHSDSQDIDGEIEKAERQIKATKMQFGDSQDSEDEPRSRLGSVMYIKGIQYDSNTQILVSRDSEQSETDQRFEK